MESKSYSNMWSSEWKKAKANSRPKELGECEHCGVRLASSTMEIRGIVLCKTCREVEEELDSLAAAEVRVRAKLGALRASYHRSPCLCILRKITEQRSILEELGNRVVDELISWDRLGGDYVDEIGGGDYSF